MATSMVHGFTLEHKVTTSNIIHGFSLIHVVGLDYEVSLDYKVFSSIPYGVAHPNMDYGYALIHGLTYSNIVYDALPSNPVRGPPLVHIT